MTEAARKAAVDELGKAVARVISLGIGAHPMAEQLMGMLDSGAITMRVVVEVGPELVVRVLAVPRDGGEVLEVLRIDPPPRGPMN